MRLIDADALTAEICKLKGCFGTSEGNEPFMAWEVEDYIKDAETVDAEPVVHAHWVPDPVGSCEALNDCEVLHHYRCSRCRRRTSCLVGKDLSVALPYCHCGAKMDEVKEDV